MMKFVLISSLLAAALSLELPQSEEGPHPAKDIDCPQYLCNGKSDGNYEYNTHEGYNSHNFLQCSNGRAECQVCWPQYLYYSQRCNQCVYEKEDECMTTGQSFPLTTMECPDICPQRGPEFSGNIADLTNDHHYAACWNGITVGCIACPADLLFNEKWNACLYNGLHMTSPTQ